MTEPRQAANPQDALDAEALALLELSLVPGLGPRIVKRLLDKFGTAQAVWEQPSARLLDVPGIGDELRRGLVAARQSPLAPAYWTRCQDEQVQILASSSPDYPTLLRNIHDPPTVLHVRGDYEPSDALAVAIVGTRHASAYGLRQASALAASLCRAGITVVSGLARGIDAAAHRTALEVGGRTVAVLAGGLQQVYPPQHKKLAAQVVKSGTLISEVPIDAKPRRGSFPRRNRLISGLSLGVVIVEATQRSGALITARHAMEQGRDVFAVPGPVDLRASRGCHQLLRDGAKLVETADDILEELGPFVVPLPKDEQCSVRHAAELQLNSIEQTVLQQIDDASTTIDQLVARCDLPVQRILSTISVLETRRLISRLAGDRVSRRFAP